MSIQETIIKENDFQSLAGLVAEIDRPGNSRFRQQVIDAMTTNETLWFRDNHPFDIFKNKLLPELQQRSGPIRIWSAACSSGQEPYSLSMLVDEFASAKLGGLKYPLEIVATDLSRSMLDLCKKAEYNGLSLGRGLAQERLQRFFEPVDDNTWRVKQPIRNRVRFQTLNLKDSFMSLGKFDVVFCRNVLIYFSADLKTDILRRIHATLRPGGYLVLGASEGLSGVGEFYQMVQCNPGIIYQAI